MTTTSPRRHRAHALTIWALGVVLVGTPAWAASDPWITTKAKIALLTAIGVRAVNVQVDTVDGAVTLHGAVGSAEEKTKVEGAVRRIEGVRSVRSLLQVVPEDEREVVEASDAELKTRVERALAADPQLAQSDVEVRSAHAGVVLLGGEVDTLPQHLRALEVASRVSGVDHVASEIKSPDGLADREIYGDPPTGESGSGRGAGTTMSDMWITSAVKLRLLADSRTPALDVNVDTNDGEVTLFGTVDSAEAKAAAEEEAKKVGGVKSVDNALQVVSDTRKEAVDAEDDEIEGRIEEQLAASDRLKGTSISVDVENGVARLTGTVPSQEDRLLAAVTARQTVGVRAVRTDLTVRR